MNGVVRGARVIGFAIKQLQRDGAGQNALALPGLADGTAGADQRQGVKRRDFVIVRMGLVQIAHALHIGRAPGLQIAVAIEQRIHRPKEPLLPRRGRFRKTCVQGRAKPLQDLLRSLPVHFRQQRMVVAQRLAPVGHREIGIRRLRRLEFRNGLLPAEAVQNGGAALEMLLGFGGLGGRWELDGADVVGCARKRRAQCQHGGDDPASHSVPSPWSGREFTATSNTGLSPADSRPPTPAPAGSSSARCGAV